MMRKIAHVLVHRIPLADSLQTPQTVLVVYSILLYTFSLLLSTGVYFLGLHLRQTVPTFDILLLFIFPVIASAWYGTFQTGLASTILLSIGYVYAVIPTSVLDSPEDAIMAIPVGFFLLAGGLISYLLHMARNVDEVALAEKEKMTYAHFLGLEKQRNKEALEEIKARDEFLSIASHELKSPLTLSLLQIQRALHNIRNVSLANFSVQKLMDMLESIEQQTDRLSTMISDLSNVSLITTGRMKLEIDEIDMNHLVKDVIERIPITMRKADYPITFTSDGEIQGKWDRMRIEQVITNLISNAIKYGENKPIDIRIVQKGSTVVISVQDSGVGIPKELQQRIFERFERGAAKKGIKGLGVGLYIVHQIVQAHGGRIELKSKPGNGTIFYIYLPRETSS